jgi:glycosyltransferase involved in cell wall biosynthesis
MARVLFVARALGGGGAERQLCVLAAALRRRGHHVAIATFYPGGPYADALLAGTGVELISLEKRRTSEIVRFFWRAARVVRAQRPDVIHGYLELGNVVATVLRAAAPRARVAWGLRNADLDLSRDGPLARLVWQASRAASWGADTLIANSAAAAEYHVRSGYPRGRMHVIHNGIDTEVFAPDCAGRARVRAELGIPPAAPVVGIVGRLDPRKGHDVFIAAARRFAAHRPEARFLCVGDGEEPHRSLVARWLDESGLDTRLVRTGFRRDMSAVYSACDIVTCASYTESFPNVLAEAMASGVPCVTTAVGEAPLIVGGTGEVVPPRDAAAMAAAWERLLTRGDGALAAACRARIVDRFSVEQLVRRTVEVLRLEPAHSCESSYVGRTQPTTSSASPATG